MSSTYCAYTKIAAGQSYLLDETSVKDDITVDKKLETMWIDD